MTNVALTVPNYLTDPGFLYWAPLGSTIPAMTVTASKFDTLWASPWVPLGPTESGTDYSPSNTTVAPVTAAEFIDPIGYRTTDRSGSVSFMLKNNTAGMLAKAMNGATTTVTGTTTTTSTKVTPPQPGQETRAMIGWESLDNSVRWIAYQVFNSGDIKLSLNKAPATANVPWTGMFEVPQSTGIPTEMWFAGALRA